MSAGERGDPGSRSHGIDEDFHRGERAYDRWLGDAYNKPSQTLGSIAEASRGHIPANPLAETRSRPPVTTSPRFKNRGHPRKFGSERSSWNL